jgi:DNA (cytosine-5)-methyltransferase 1
LNAREVFLKVKRVYRPADTHLGRDACFRSDWNVVYWSDEIHKLKLNKVVVKCVLVYSAAIDEPIEEFVRNEPNRMYSNKAYNPAEREFEPPPVEAERIGSSPKGKGGKSLKSAKPTQPSYPTYPKIEPLKTLNIFAGCGGLSEGLHQSGVAKTY